MTKVRTGRYGAAAMGLHWGMAVLIIAAWGVGHTLESLPPGAERAAAFGLHKSVGVLVLLLVLVRLGVRSVLPQPGPLAGGSAAERLITQLVHAGLYALMLAIPLGGILMSQSGGHAVALFGLPLPTVIGKDDDLHALFQFGHQALGWVLALALFAHVGAALRHHLLLKDDTLRRILPGGR